LGDLSREGKRRVEQKAYLMGGRNRKTPKELERGIA